MERTGNPRPASPRRVAVENHEHAKAMLLVGVGASNEDRDSFCELVNPLPADCGLSFVLPGCDPGVRPIHLPVEQVEKPTCPKPNHVYYTPRGISMEMKDGALVPCLNGSFPIDQFLSSLAREQRDNAVGVLLSREVSDGVRGLQSIQVAGGITMARKPSITQAAPMLKPAAIDGAADLILTPVEMATRLREMVQRSSSAQIDRDATAPSLPARMYERFLEAIQDRTGMDFRHYRKLLVDQRIRRRMRLMGFSEGDDYLRYFLDHSREIDTVSDELCLRVRYFFSSPEVADTLAREAYPKIMKDRAAGESIRIWIPGCGNGEQAYSIAMNLIEFQERTGSTFRLKIVGSDISETTIRKAYAGLYDASALSYLPADQISRFFDLVDGRYRVRKSIRDICTFARQNPVVDAPFVKMDLIFCDGTLNPVDPAWHKKILSNFHFSLNSGGVLILGAMDRISRYAGQFERVDGQPDIYIKRAADLKPDSSPVKQEAQTPDQAERTISQQLVDRLLLARYAPASAVVDRSMNVVRLIGSTQAYLEAPVGKRSHLLTLVREDIAETLKRAWSDAIAKNRAVSEPVRVVRRGVSRSLLLRVVPLVDTGYADRSLFVIVFDEPGMRSYGANRLPDGEGPENWKDREIWRLREEIREAHILLEAMTARQEGVGRDPAAADRSTPSRPDELALRNGQLSVLNNSLHEHNVALIQTNADLTNVLTSIDISLVMIERDFTIRRFTKEMRSMFNLVNSDIGRPITDLRSKIPVSGLQALLHGVIHGENPAPQEVRATDGRWYQLRVLPYRLEDTRIDGAILVLIDIDHVKRARDYAESIVQSVRQPLLVLSRQLQIKTANQAFYQTFHLSPASVENRSLYDLEGGRWDHPAIRSAVEGALDKHDGIEPRELKLEIAGAGVRTVLVSAGRLQELSASEETDILLAIEDVTERKEAELRRLELLKSTLATASEKMLRQKDAELARISRALTVGELASSISHEVNQPIAGVVTNAEAALRWLNMRPADIENTRQSLSLIVRDANRASGIIRRMRDFLRKEKASTVALDLREVIDEASTLVEAEFNKHQVAFHLDIPPGLPSVLGDPIQIQQVVLNLLLNACEAMSEVSDRPRDISVSAQSAGDEVLVKVRDTGPGVEKQSVDRMFDALFTTKPSGMGLGLSISRSIIEAHGGRIWCEVNDGPGLTMLFSVPAAPPPTAPAEPEN